MFPRRRLPPRPELSAEQRAAFAQALRARRERTESPEERAKFLASLESYIARATASQLKCTRTSSIYHSVPSSNPMTYRESE
jgi:hypothetical protein